MILRLYIILAIAYFSASASAQIVFEHNETELNISKKVDYYIDSNQSTQIRDVMKIALNQKISSHFDIPNLQLTNYSFWFKFQLKIIRI